MFVTDSHPGARVPPFHPRSRPLTPSSCARVRPMRFVVYGAGAIGGVVGGRLAQAGHEVVLIARGDHHDAIRDEGLRLVVPYAEPPIIFFTLVLPAAGAE